MNATYALISIVVGYLVGSLSATRIVHRLGAPQVDLGKTTFGLSGVKETVESEMVSATALSMRAGPKLGFLSAAGDMFKVAVPTLLIRRIYPEAPYYLLTAIAGVIGHIWPIYFRFKGGRGMSAIYGGLFAIDFIGVFATSLLGMVFGLVIVRDILVAYMAGYWLLIPWLWFRTHDLAHVLYAVAVNVILLIGLIPEMKQYLKLRRQGIGGDVSEVMQLTPMGKGMYKISERLRLMKRKPVRDSKAEQEDPQGQ
jgi:glycerol-3-phosphate acyltransferase PlsY